MSKKKVWILIIGFAILFLFVRLPGLDLPYHQDEWKNVKTSENMVDAGNFFAHPPLMQMIFVAGYELFGPDNLRVVPLLFAIGSAILLYFVVHNRIDKKAALWSVGLFSICSYNVLGSLVPDVDGSILPFFFLLGVLAYDKWLGATGSIKRRWFSLLVAALLIGFLVKLNFIIAVGAIALDYAWAKRREATLKKSLVFFAALAGFGVIYALLLYVIQFIYPAFDIGFMFDHAGQFSEDVSRNWIQIAVQGSKALFYLSPLLLLPVLFVSRSIWIKTRVFNLYLLAGFVFYFILFDFSRGALDKYLMYAIVPLAALVGVIFSETFTGEKDLSKWRWPVLGGIGLAAVLYWLNFLPHEVLPLYPKTLWFSRALGGDWNFLNPFHGGSGPLGFYVSFLFIVSSFIAAAFFTAAGLIKKQWRTTALIVIFITGLSYNLVFTEELLWGRVNGSSKRVLDETIAYISSNPAVTRVMTYNDIGAGPLEGLGKYERRIYATPDAESGYRELFKKHEIAGHYLVVDIPRINSQSFYGQYFAMCDSLFKTTSGRITADVYECNSK